MRNPIQTIDIIIQGKSNGNNNNTTVLLVKRKKDPFKDYFALPGDLLMKAKEWKMQ